MERQDLEQRTLFFARRCVRLALILPQSILGIHICKQLIRSPTSVASNYRATCLAQSKKEFIAKISIALEETDESNFWIEFIDYEKLVKSEKLAELIKESRELVKIFAASRITARKNLKNNNSITKNKQ